MKACLMSHAQLLLAVHRIVWLQGTVLKKNAVMTTVRLIVLCNCSTLFIWRAPCQWIAVPGVIYHAYHKLHLFYNVK